MDAKEIINEVEQLLQVYGPEAICKTCGKTREQHNRVGSRLIWVHIDPKIHMFETSDA